MIAVKSLLDLARLLELVERRYGVILPRVLLKLSR